MSGSQALPLLLLTTGLPLVMLVALVVYKLYFEKRPADAALVAYFTPLRRAISITGIAWVILMVALHILRR